MKSVYKDPNITLRNLRMIQFDPSHDVPSLIEILAKQPNLIDIQDRTLISRVIGITAARKDRPTTIVVGVKELTLLSCLLLFLYGNESRHRLLLSLPVQPSVSENAVVADLMEQLRPDNVANDLPSLISAAVARKDFLIALLPSGEKDNVRTVIDALTDGQAGVLLVKNYGLLDQGGHHEYCRERGLRIVQQTDGSAELWNLNF